MKLEDIARVKVGKADPARISRQLMTRNGQPVQLLPQVSRKHPQTFNGKELRRNQRLALVDGQIQVVNTRKLLEV